jgi:hypothetical protein
MQPILSGPVQSEVISFCSYESKCMLENFHVPTAKNMKTNIFGDVAP